MIRRFALGFDKMPLRFAVATLFMVGCSASAEDPTPQSGGGSGPSGGTSNFGGAGGSLPLAGQPPAAFGGAAGSGVSGSPAGGSGGGTAGKAGTAGSSAGGTAAVAGSTSVAGSAPVAGAPAAGSGAGGAATCDTYNGTAKTPSDIFTSGYGKSGTWQGYAYTFTFGTGVVVTPGSSTTMSCFPMMQMCSAGSVPAADTAGAGLGWSINQMMGGTAGAVAIATPVNFKLKGATAGMRVGLVPPGTSAMEFCYTLKDTDAATANSTAGLTVALTDFKSACYDAATATAYDGEMIQAIQVSVPGSASAAKTFDFCIIDIKAG